jgi:hypothetical protein
MTEPLPMTFFELTMDVEHHFRGGLMVEHHPDSPEDFFGL